MCPCVSWEEMEDRGDNNKDKITGDIQEDNGKRKYKIPELNSCS